MLLDQNLSVGPTLHLCLGVDLRQKVLVVVDHLPVEVGESATHQVNLDGTASPAHDKSAVVAMILSGKANALDNLAPLLKTAKILELERFQTSRAEVDEA